MASPLSMKCTVHKMQGSVANDMRVLWIQRKSFNGLSAFLKLIESRRRVVCMYVIPPQCFPLLEVVVFVTVYSYVYTLFVPGFDN